MIQYRVNQHRVWTDETWDDLMLEYYADTYTYSLKITIEVLRGASFKEVTEKLNICSLCSTKKKFWKVIKHLYILKYNTNLTVGSKESLKLILADKNIILPIIKKRLKVVEGRHKSNERRRAIYRMRFAKYGDPVRDERKVQTLLLMDRFNAHQNANWNAELQKFKPWSKRHNVIG